MCAEATRFGSRRNAPKSILHRNAGRPMEKSPQKSIMVCNKCATRISRGNKHSCTTTSLISNTRLSLQYRNCVGHFIADGIVRKLGRATNFYSTLARLGGGHLIHINVSASKSLAHPIAKNTLHLDMKDISSFKRACVGMTNNMLKQVTPIIRKAGVKCPTTASYYHERDGLCQDCIEILQLNLYVSKEKHKVNLKPIWAVRCSDNKLLEKFYNHEGNVDVSQMQFKLGLDFGRGFLKLLISERFNNSVNKVYYLWVAEVPESLYNFRAIFEHEQMKVLISNYYVSFTVDLKEASILSGIMLG